MISKKLLILLVKVTMQFDFSYNAQQCNDLGAARACHSACSNRLSECRFSCGQIDEDCFTRCNIDFGDCFADCPCGARCPAGCSDCDSQFCKCQDNPEDDPSYKVCEDKAGADFYDCQGECGLGDVACQVQCNRDLADQVEKCPCKSGCPYGCPCPDYECPSTTPIVTTTATSFTTATSTMTTAVVPAICPVPSLSIVCVEECLYDNQQCKKNCDASLECQHECDQQLIPCIESCPCYSQCPAGCDDCANLVCNVPDSVLIMNTGDVDNVPLVVDGFGNSRQPNFVLEAETEVYWSCGVTFDDRMYIYGGADQTTQISRVVGCALKRLGTLPFEHYYGACGTGRSEIYLCFNNNSNDAKKCRKSSDPERNFEAITNSNFEHRYTRIASSQGVLFAVGDGNSNHNKAETYTFESGEWTSVAAYPFSSYIRYAPVVHSRNSFYVIGGATAETSYSTIIARFSSETQSWTEAGNLNNGRYRHGAIELGQSFLVIGGYSGIRPTEKCTINAYDEVQCNYQKPDLTNYSTYPELFNVSYDFC